MSQTLSYQYLNSQIQYIPIITYMPIYNFNGQMTCAQGNTYYNYKFAGYVAVTAYLPMQMS